MAGHGRSVDTGTTQRGTSGKTRRARRHLPAGEAAAARRTKAHSGARSLANDRVRRAKTPEEQLIAAHDYVRSAMAKYTPGSHTGPAVEALLAAGDRIYQHGSPRRKR